MTYVIAIRIGYEPVKYLQDYSLFPSLDFTTTGIAGLAKHFDSLSAATFVMNNTVCVLYPLATTKIIPT